MKLYTWLSYFNVNYYMLSHVNAKSRGCQGHVTILTLSNKLSKLPDVRYHHPKQIKIQNQVEIEFDLYILDTNLTYMYSTRILMHLTSTWCVKLSLKNSPEILKNFLGTFKHFWIILRAWESYIELFNKML